MKEKDRFKYENLLGATVIDCFYYSKNMLLISIIPASVTLGFGLELSFFHFIFPKGGSFLITLLGWIALFVGILALFLISYKLLNPKSFLILTERGLYANVVMGNYLFFFLGKKS